MDIKQNFLGEIYLIKKYIFKIFFMMLKHIKKEWKEIK